MSDEQPTPPEAAPAPETESPSAPPAEAPGPDDLQAQLAAARGRLAEAEATAQEAAAREAELVDRLKRLQADFENYRRRAREEAAAASARGKEQFLRDLLPVLDSLDRALAHTEDEGLRLVARQLEGALQAQGIIRLDPQGETFDATRHEAVARAAREGVKPDTVLEVVERGYLLDGRLLRPARVVVAGEGEHS